MKTRQPSLGRTVIVVAILFGGVVPIVMFLARWFDTSFEEAWDTFDEFVEKCLA